MTCSTDSSSTSWVLIMMSGERDRGLRQPIALPRNGDALTGSGVVINEMPLT